MIQRWVRGLRGGEGADLPQLKDVEGNIRRVETFLRGLVQTHQLAYDPAHLSSPASAQKK
jgi:hypothetical protein